jgi:hypothetical protein
LLPFLTACQPYRIEYHTRPAFYAAYSAQPLPDELELSDGTRIIYRDSKPSKPESDPDAPMLEIREEKENGEIILRCVTPEHVIANLMTCVRNEEYELIWEQLLAKAARAGYEDAAREPALGAKQFAEFMADNREEIMTTLNRMRFGFMGPDVVLEAVGHGNIRARFTPQVSEQFKFKSIDMVLEDGLMKVRMIR